MFDISPSRVIQPLVKEIKRTDRQLPQETVDVLDEHNKNIRWNRLGVTQYLDKIPTPKSITSTTAKPPAIPKRTFTSPEPASKGEKGGKFGIHDTATIFNLGMAVRNATQEKPGWLSLARPVASTIQKNSAPITDQGDKAISQINAGVAAAGKAQRGVGATLAAQSLGNAALLRVANQTGSQVSQYLNSVDSANAQIGNTVAAQRAEVDNAETTINAQIEERDADKRGAAVTSNIQSAVQNQTEKRKEEEYIKQRDMNTLIQTEAIKAQLEQEAFASPEYSAYELQRKTAIQEEITKELGDAEDLENPIYTETLTGADKAFEKKFKEDPFTKAYNLSLKKYDDEKTALLGKDPDSDVTGIDQRISGLNEGYETMKELAFEGYKKQVAQKHYTQELGKRFQEQASLSILQEEYRELKGIEKSDFSGLMKLYNN